MLKKIGHYSIENPVSVYDEEAMTALELAGRTAKKVNDCIDTINRHLKDCADTINTHIDDCEEEHQGHRTEVAGIVQAHKTEVSGIVQEQERKNVEARQYMKDNLEQTCGDLFDQAVEGGVFDTVTREAYAKLTAGSYNVLDFGAKGDGITDDTQAIQSAIEASREGNGSNVYLPAGDYRVTEPLVIYSHTRLIGAGKRGISNNGFSGTQITGDTVSPVIRSDPNAEMVYGAEIRDIRVGKTNGSTTAYYGLYMENMSECYLHNVTVNGGFTVGMYFKGGLTNLDNLYICANQTGIILEDTHAVTVSNLNAWINTDKAISLVGDCFNLNIRDSWIENSQYGVYVDTSSKAFSGSCVNIQNTSFTCGTNLNGTTVSSAYFIYGVKGVNNLSLNNLIVRSCVAKIVQTDYAIRLGSNSNTITASVENCVFFTNNSFTAGILVDQKYHPVKVENLICKSYSGTKFDTISGGRVFGIESTGQYTEIKGIMRLADVTGTSLEAMDGGQVYYKNGHLYMTDGTASRTIPVGKGEEISLVFPVGVDTGLTDWLSDLVGILHRSGILNCPSIKDELG